MLRCPDEPVYIYPFVLFPLLRTQQEKNEQVLRKRQDKAETLRIKRESFSMVKKQEAAEVYVYACQRVNN